MALYKMEFSRTQTATIEVEAENADAAFEIGYDMVDNHAADVSAAARWTTGTMSVVSVQG